MSLSDKIKEHGEPNYEWYILDLKDVKDAVEKLKEELNDKGFICKDKKCDNCIELKEILNEIFGELNGR